MPYLGSRSISLENYPPSESKAGFLLDIQNDREDEGGCQV